MSNPIADQLRSYRDERIANFALDSILAVVQITGGKVPYDADARNLVRLARTVYSEIDRPTEPDPEPEAAPTATTEPADLLEELGYGQ